MSLTRVATLVHNGKNRLATVIGHLAAQPSDDPAWAEDIRQLRSVASQLSTILGWLRAESPDGGLRLHEVDLEMFLQDVAGEARVMTPAHLTFTTALDLSACQFPLWSFDALLVRCVLLDALANAWRHAERQITLNLCGSDGGVEFTIVDDGPGYPAALLNDPEGAPLSTQGSGEGLRLAQRIASQHHVNGRRGCIKLSNACAPAHGACFRLWLP